MDAWIRTNVANCIYACGALFVFVWLRVSVQQVRTGYVRLVERFGVFHRVLKPGIHIIWWPVEMTRYVYWQYTQEKHTSGGTQLCDVVEYTPDIPTQSRTFDLAPTKTCTKDMLDVTVNVVLTFRILEVAHAVYNVQDLMQSLEGFVQTAIRETAASLSLTELVSDKGGLRTSILETLKDMETDWGVKVGEIRIQSVAPSVRVLRQTEELVQQKMEFEQKKLRERVERESRSATQRLDLELEMEQAKHDCELEMIQLRARREKDKAESGRIAALLKGGMPTEYFLAEQWGVALRNMPAKLKTLIMPSPMAAGAGNVNLTKML